MNTATKNKRTTGASPSQRWPYRWGLRVPHRGIRKRCSHNRGASLIPSALESQSEPSRLDLVFCFDPGARQVGEVVRTDEFRLLGARRTYRSFVRVMCLAGSAADPVKGSLVEMTK